MNREKAVRGVRIMTLMIFGISIPASAQIETIYRVPAGTHLRLSVDVELSSKAASVNDTFLARVTRPLKVDDAVVLPEGAIVEGRVTRVSRAGGFGRSGSMSIVFERLSVFGGSRAIDGTLASAISADRTCFLLAYFVRGHEARLRKGEEFEIEIKRDVSLPVTAY